MSSKIIRYFYLYHLFLLCLFPIFIIVANVPKIPVGVGFPTLGFFFLPAIICGIASISIFYLYLPMVMIKHFKSKIKIEGYEKIPDEINREFDRWYDSIRNESNPSINIYLSILKWIEPSLHFSKNSKDSSWGEGILETKISNPSFPNHIITEDLVEGAVNNVNIQFMETYQTGKGWPMGVLFTADYHAKDKRDLLIISKSDFLKSYLISWKTILWLIPLCWATFFPIAGTVLLKLLLSYKKKKEKSLEFVYPFKKADIIRVENKLLNKKYYILGKDQVDARYILSLTLMERLLLVSEKFINIRSVIFSGGKLFMHIRTATDLFNDNPHTDYNRARLKVYFYYVKSFVDIVRELKLRAQIKTAGL